MDSFLDNNASTPKVVSNNDSPSALTKNWITLVPTDPNQTYDIRDKSSTCR
jgi:acetyl-CoA carboxylase carboxyltransferase component